MNLLPKSKFLFLIAILAFVFRTYGIDWDEGHHLHPDERMLIMVAERIHFPDQLNPDFFNYGSLPIYILKGTAQALDSLLGQNTANYDGMLYLGRMLSAIFDIGTLILIFKTALILFDRLKPRIRTAIALWASLFYAIAFFPIQNSHFFIVDTFLTFFVTLCLFLLILFIKKPSLRLIVFLAVSLAAALTTKVTALILVPVVLFGIVIGTLLEYKMKHFIYVPLYFVIFIWTLVTASYFFMPYAFVNYKQFISEISAQLAMNSDPFVFPYTLQYVNTTPYLYYLKNIMLWGIGPFITIAVGVGLYFGTKTLKNEMAKETNKHTYRVQVFKAFVTNKTYISIIVFCGLYILFFLVLGRSAVKFMRYMLPLYPALALIAGYGLYRLSSSKRKLFIASAAIIVFCALGWTLMFMSVYTRPHTRITASRWIYQNIPEGATIAVEHWDDRLPLRLGSPKDYTFEELALYESDTAEKWQTINSQLERTDYVILASNRLYTPLPNLADCASLPPGRCYPRTKQYYEDLFAGSRGFTLVAEFSSYPGIEFGGLTFEIPDDVADESFTVYDHPKVLIFERN